MEQGEGKRRCAVSLTEAVVREMKRRVLSLAHFIEYRAGKSHIEGLLKGYDPEPVVNRRPEKCRSIAFVITRMVRFHGGQTSVLRLGTQLEKQGMKVYYLTYKKQSAKEIELCASANLAGCRGKCMPLKTYLKKEAGNKTAGVDFVCATSWDTVSYAKKLKNAYKLYFIQDYEPYFYKYGEEFLMCRSTYFQGLHMISLGSWNRDMILKDLTQRLCGNDQCEKNQPGGYNPETADSFRKDPDAGAAGVPDVVDFPYEPGEYTDDRRDYLKYADRKKFTIAVYLKYYGKRLPAFIPYMLCNTVRKLKAYGIELEVLYFGEAKTFRAAGGVNLGQLNRSELAGLYRRADFGMVASMSNISLVPYEMHASGLPVIEFADGTYTHFLPADSAILTDITKTDIADELLAVIREPERLERMHRSAVEAMKGLSWENTGRQFHSILEKTVCGNR